MPSQILLRVCLQPAAFPPVLPGRGQPHPWLKQMRSVMLRGTLGHQAYPGHVVFKFCLQRRKLRIRETIFSCATCEGHSGEVNSSNLSSNYSYQLRWDRFGREMSQFLRAKRGFSAAVRAVLGSLMRCAILCTKHPVTPLS